MPRYRVAVEWTDADVMDADEVIVHADTPAQAIDHARKQWRLTIGADWPSCRLERAFVLTPAKSAAFL
jgi:hypothetical protein